MSHADNVGLALLLLSVGAIVHNRPLWALIFLCTAVSFAP